MPPIDRRLRAMIAMLASALVVASSVVGCSEPEPPPLTKEGFEAAQKDREEIIRKEYGESAFNKATKQAPKASPKAP